MNNYFETEIQNISHTIFKQQEHKDFYKYLCELHLVSKSSNHVLILPSNNHFYYEKEEIEDYKTVVNLKKLNYIKKLDNFLYSLYHTINKDAIFCGCFINNKHIKSDLAKFRYAKLFESFLLIIDSIMFRLLSEKDVCSFLKIHNFEVLNLKEIKGVTYFYAKKIVHQV